ncbi:MAG: hypothetical protein OXC61_07695 [Flavobacteriaceae bacterium]|nr:hypothetical protein [Flavobacteriaceae bacterium]
MNITHFFLKPELTSHKHYEALRMYFVEQASAQQVAQTFGFTYRAITSLVSDFKKVLQEDQADDSLFFVRKKKGRPVSKSLPASIKIIVALRKKNRSVEDIKIALDALGETISERSIHLILRAEGFARLPKRSHQEKKAMGPSMIPAPKSRGLSFLEAESFKVGSGGM